MKKGLKKARKEQQQIKIQEKLKNIAKKLAYQDEITEAKQKPETKQSGDLICTGIDVLLDLVRKKKKISLAEAATITKYPKGTIEDWANILEEEGLVTIEYKFTKTYLVFNEGRKQDDRKEVRKTVLKGALSKKDKTSKISVDETAVDDYQEDVINELQKERSVQSNEKEEIQAEEDGQENNGFIERLKLRKHQKAIINETEKMHGEIEKLRKEEESLRNSIAELEKKPVVSEDELKEEIKKVIELEQNDIKEAGKKPEELNEKLVSLRETINKQQAEIAELKKTNAVFSSEEKRLVNEMCKLQKKSSLAQSGKLKINSRPMFHLIASHVSHSGISAKYKKEIDEIQGQIANLNQAQRDIDESLKTMHHENLSLKEHEKKLHKEVTDFLKSEEEKLTSRVDSLNMKIELIEKKKMRFSKKPLLSVFQSGASGTSKKYREEMANLQKKLDSLSTVQKSLQAQILKLNKDTTSLKKTDTFLKNELSSLKRPAGVCAGITYNWQKYRQHKMKQAKAELALDRKEDLQEKADELKNKREELTEKKQELHSLAEIKTLKGVAQSELVKAKMLTSDGNYLIRKSAFRGVVQTLLGTKRKIIQNDQNKLSKSYQQLIAEANKDLEKHDKYTLKNNSKVFVRHEPFAANLIKMIEEEEKRKAKLSRSKIKTLRNKKQRVMEKLKKLELEKRAIVPEKFTNEKQSLNHVLDRINSLLDKK